MTYVIVLTDGARHIPVAIYKTRSGVEAFITENPTGRVTDRINEAAALLGVAAIPPGNWYKVLAFCNDSLVDVDEREDFTPDLKGSTDALVPPATVRV